MQNKSKHYLVTGGTGFLGQPLVARLISQGHRVTAVARNEGKLLELKELFPDITIIQGDVANEYVVRQCMAPDIHGIFHLAAMKHVGLSEKMVLQCINSNIRATENILEASLGCAVEFVIGISTDKAAQVRGVYGASKLLMERLFTYYEGLGSDIRFRTVRYGNVLYSTGSVLTKWKKRIKEGKQVTVTDMEATRFFWTREQAIDHIFNCLKKAPDSTPWIPEMKAMRIFDLLEAMRLKYGNGKAIELEIIGLQPGENLHEKIHEDGPYSNEVPRYNIKEIMDLV